jgi:Tfp pilus tip-associated adhesin PilY1
MKRNIGIAILCISIFLSAVQLHADDTELFITQLPPDALILLDMSGSMNYAPSGPPYTSAPNRRIDIARAVILDFLDDNDDSVLDAKDEKSLNIRLGYMRFWNSYNNDDNEPTSGSIKVLSNIGSAYSDIWSKVNDAAEASPVGGTPLAASLAETMTYFTRDVNPVDPGLACRQKFVILITDGADTYACSGNGVDPGSGDESSNPVMYRRRMLTVQRAKELHDSGMEVFVVGFGGSMPDRLKRTLNWAARYGGTDNPLDANSGDPSAYDVTKYGNACTTNNSNADPASYPLSGYAFLAEDASQLSAAIKTIVKFIQEKSLSFTAPSIPSVRLVDKDVVYISSFIPNDTPFWRGNLKAYQLKTDGTLPVDKDGYPSASNLIWDASEKLKAQIPNSRTIHTYINNTLIPFTYTNLANADLAVISDAERANLINHIRGIDSYDINGNGNTTEIREWKLGDIFHSNAAVVGEPSRFFEDVGFSGPGGFYLAKKDRTKVIVVGANDGMLHAFDAATGVEKWAFIPNALLKNLKLSIATHTYFVDSSPKVADVWFPSSSGDTTKSADEWKTVLISGLRKGGSSYFALDITDTLNPKYLWEFPKATDAVTQAKVGQSWPEPAIGRVKIETGGTLVERWVAFVSGGFDYNNTLGRALFVVDLKTGDILWEFSCDAAGGEKQYMVYSIAAAPMGVDVNGDGFVDKVYAGDLGGQMWVFDVSFNSATNKSDSRWFGKRLFKAPVGVAERHSIYYQPAIAFDGYRVPWVYFGTGDREFPKDLSHPAERFYAVKDDGNGTYPRTESDLSNVTANNTYTKDPLKSGWTIQLGKSVSLSEKVLAKPVVFNGLVYFTTYSYTASADPCSVAGAARLYVVEYLSGGGAVLVNKESDLEGTPSQRYVDIGAGIPSAPVISVSLKGKASVIVGTTGSQVFSKEAFSPKKFKDLLYWRNLRP